MPTVAVPPGAFSITITGTFSASYQVFVSANWPTELPIVNKTLTSFDVDPFTMPAPVGAEIDYFVVGGATPPPAAGAVTLQDYMNETRRLLRDKTTTGAQVIWSDEDLAAFINRAMQQRDLDLGLNKALIRFPLTTQQPYYPFASIVAGGTVIVGAPTPNIMDILAITVYPIGPAPTGGIKYNLSRLAYPLVAMTTSTSWMSYPRWYALLDPTTVVVGPPPAQAYLTEIYAKTWPTGLVNTTDADPMPYPYTDPIPFIAAAFAKMESQRQDEADAFMATATRRMNLVRSGSRPFAVKEPFFGLPTR